MMGNNMSKIGGKKRMIGVEMHDWFFGDEASKQCDKQFEIPINIIFDGIKKTIGFLVGIFGQNKKHEGMPSKKTFWFLH